MYLRKAVFGGNKEEPVLCSAFIPGIPAALTGEHCSIIRSNDVTPFEHADYPESVSVINDRDLVNVLDREFSHGNVQIIPGRDRDHRFGRYVPGIHDPEHAVIEQHRTHILYGHDPAQASLLIDHGKIEPVALDLRGDSIATLVIGESLTAAADLLHTKSGVPDYRFPHLLGLDAVDSFVHLLSELAERPVPARIARQRAQLQDAMVDCDFMIGLTPLAIAAEPDQLLAMSELLQGMGAEVVAAVSPERGAALEKLQLSEVKLGDLEDLESMARNSGARLLIGNSHVAQSAERLKQPLLRCGFPQYDTVGGYQRSWIGYGGTRQALFDIANLLLQHPHAEIEPYRSKYSQKRD